MRLAREKSEAKASLYAFPGKTKSTKQQQHLPLLLRAYYRGSRAVKRCHRKANYRSRASAHDCTSGRWDSHKNIIKKRTITKSQRSEISSLHRPTSPSEGQNQKTSFNSSSENTVRSGGLRFPSRRRTQRRRLGTARCRWLTLRLSLPRRAEALPRCEPRPRPNWCCCS